MIKNDNISVTESSGNIFKDIGLPNPELLLAKAEITYKINSFIKKKKLTRGKASKILDITYDRLVLISKGLTSGITLNKLVSYLNKLKEI